MYNLMFYIFALMVIIVYHLCHPAPGRLEARPGLDRGTRRRNRSHCPGNSAGDDETGRLCRRCLFCRGHGRAAGRQPDLYQSGILFLHAVDRGARPWSFSAGSGSIPGVILGAATVTILNLQVLQGFSLYLNELRQSDAVIPIINFAWKDLSTQLDPAKYQRLLFGLILILMMIFRPAGLIPPQRRKRKLDRKRRSRELEKGASWHYLKSSDVTKTFGGLKAISDVNFSLEKGRIVIDHRPERCRQDHLFQHPDRDL